MKYCKHCGRRLEDFDNVCPDCGTVQNENMSGSYEPVSHQYYKDEYVPAPGKRNSTTILLWIVASLGVILIGCIIALLLNNGEAKEEEDTTPTGRKSTIFVQKDGTTVALNGGEAKMEAPAAPAAPEAPAAPAPSRPQSRISSYGGSTLPVFEGGGSLIEEHLGANWRQTAGSRLNGAIMLNGGGSVGRGSVKIEAALLPNGRIVGRNSHSSGDRLDVNGIVYSDGSVTIQLGHGAKTSYYYLYPAGRSGNTFYLTGTWDGGPNNTANTSISLTAS